VALEARRRAAGRSGLSMAAIGHVFTLARVAALLGEDEDWLHEISLDLDPEDGVLAVYGPGDEYTPAFTELGLENLRELIRIHRESAERRAIERRE
jgi:hypothetical protein